MAFPAYDSKDLRQTAYETWVSVRPVLLDQPALAIIGDLLAAKLIGTVNRHYGFILDVSRIQLMDNKIGENGYVDYRVAAVLTSVLPTVGMVFTGVVTTILLEGCITDNPHFQNLLVGGKKTAHGYITPCGCLLTVGATTAAVVEATAFQRGKYTCICRHIC